MKRLACAIALLLASLGAAGAFWQSRLQVAISGGAAFSGPGDVLSSGVQVWGGLRAYSAAQRGTKAINICDPSDVQCAIWNTDATTGNLVATTNPLNGTDCTAVTTCTVKTLYDQSGQTNCSAAACDLTQATAASRPTLTWNCQNSHPCLVFSGTQSLSSAAGISTVTQPGFISAVAKQTINNGNVQIWGATGCAAIFTNFDNDTSPYCGVSLSHVAATDNTMHTLEYIINDGSSASTTYVDGTSTATSVGTSTTFISGTVIMGTGLGALKGQVTEAGAWTGTVSGAVASNMASNQKTYWGTP